MKTIAPTPSICSQQLAVWLCIEMVSLALRGALLAPFLTPFPYVLASTRTFTSPDPNTQPNGSCIQPPTKPTVGKTWAGSYPPYDPGGDGMHINPLLTSQPAGLRHTHPHAIYEIEKGAEMRGRNTSNPSPSSCGPVRRSVDHIVMASPFPSEGG